MPQEDGSALNNLSALWKLALFQEGQSWGGGVCGGVAMAVIAPHIPSLVTAAAVL